jgi:hypothetical protein
MQALKFCALKTTALFPLSVRAAAFAAVVFAGCGSLSGYIAGKVKPQSRWNIGSGCFYYPGSWGRWRTATEDSADPHKTRYLHCQPLRA